MVHNQTMRSSTPCNYRTLTAAQPGRHLQTPNSFNTNEPVLTYYMINKVQQITIPVVVSIVLCGREKTGKKRSILLQAHATRS